MMKEKKDYIIPVPLRTDVEVNMIRIILCDDDSIFLKRMRDEIRTVLKQMNYDAVIHVFDAAEDIPEPLLDSCDIFFLDIDFTGKKYTGIDIAKKICFKRQDSIVIFLTNYIEYAPEGYEVQAFRYVLKNEAHRKLEQYLREAIDKVFTEQESIQFNISGEPVTLNLEDILYIESQAHIAVIYTQKANSTSSKVKEYKIYSSLTNLERQLSDRGFLRIQKSFLINMRRIKQFKCTGATLDNDSIIPVSEKTYAQQKKKYLLWKGQK